MLSPPLRSLCMVTVMQMALGLPVSLTTRIGASFGLAGSPTGSTGAHSAAAAVSGG